MKDFKQLAKLLLEARKDKTIIEREVIGKTFEMQIERKAISIDAEKKQATFVMSTESIDRHGDIIDQASWILKYFETNPGFFLQHESYSFPIGKWIKVWLEPDPDNVGKQRLCGTAEFRVQFDDAARAFVHVQEGDMNMVSVGFIPHRIEYDEEKDCFILYDCELLECSLVGIGSNRDALIKEKDGDDLKEIKEVITEARDTLDKKIQKHENIRVINNLRALELLSKAIRQIK